MFAFKTFVFRAKRKLTESRLQRLKDAKVTARYKWMLIVTELFNIAVNYLEAKKSARYSQVLVLSGTQSILNANAVCLLLTTTS